MNQIVRFAHRSPLLALALTLVATGAILAACGSSGGHGTPTPVPSPTSVPPPTLQPGQVTVGSLLARINGSWSTVRNDRSEFVTKVTNNAGGTPVANEQTRVVTEEIKPDQRRIVTSDSTGTTEMIRIGSRIYMRGAFVAALVAPNVGPNDWVAIDPSIVPPDSPVGEQVAGLTAPIDAPYQTVSDQMKQRAATPAGQVQAGGRACTAYTFADVSPNGGKIDYTLAIDANNLICSLTETAGTVENVTTFTFNVPGLRITAPEVATPVAATPEG